MCKYWVVVEKGKIIEAKLPKDGNYVLCSECGLINMIRVRKQGGK
jgi:hypothetical protein